MNYRIGIEIHLYVHYNVGYIIAYRVYEYFATSIPSLSEFLEEEVCCKRRAQFYFKVFFFREITLVSRAECRYRPFVIQ